MRSWRLRSAIAVVSLAMHNSGSAAAEPSRAQQLMRGACVAEVEAQGLAVEDGEVSEVGHRRTRIATRRSCVGDSELVEDVCDH